MPSTTVRPEYGLYPVVIIVQLLLITEVAFSECRARLSMGKSKV